LVPTLIERIFFYALDTKKMQIVTKRREAEDNGDVDGMGY
jgi:hypothetical protein